MATYRSLDPAMAIWGQVDPKAEAVKSMSPYCSMGNNPISNADPDGDLFFVMPHISFSGGFSLGVTVGVGLPFGLNASATGGYNFGADKAFGSVGLNAGINVGGLNLGGSLSYGTGGASAGLGVGANSGNFGLSLGGVGYSSSGIGLSGPSAGYAFQIGGQNSQNGYSEEGSPDDSSKPIDYTQENAEKYFKEGYGDVPEYTQLIADGSYPEYMSTFDGFSYNKDGYLTKGNVHKFGITEPIGRTGNSRMYIFKSAFSSRSQLLSTMGHEFYHARLMNAGIFGGARHHAAISVWQKAAHRNLGMSLNRPNTMWNYTKSHFMFSDLLHMPPYKF